MLKLVMNTRYVEVIDVDKLWNIFEKEFNTDFVSEFNISIYETIINIYHPINILIDIKN